MRGAARFVAGARRLHGRFQRHRPSARHDVTAAVALLEQRRPGRPVVVHGTSMGAAAAVFAAGELGRRVDGYILECPYRDLETAVWNRTRNSLPPVLDRVAYVGLRLVAPLVLPELERIAPVQAITGVPAEVPVLIMAGGRARKARPEESRAIFERIRSHATLAVFADAGHVRLRASDPLRYRQTVLGFLTTIVRTRQP